MSDTERMLEQVLFEQLEVDFSDTAPVVAKLPVVQRSKFRFELDAFAGADIRSGLQIASPNTYDSWQVEAIGMESYLEIREHNLKQMEEFLRPMVEENQIGPLLAIRGIGVCVGLKQSGNTFHSFPLEENQILFGSLQGTAYGDYASLAKSELDKITDIRQIGELPTVIGGAVLLERVDVCEGPTVARVQTHVMIPIHESDFQFAVAQPVE